MFLSDNRYFLITRRSEVGEGGGSKGGPFKFEFEWRFYLFSPVMLMIT